MMTDTPFDLAPYFDDDNTFSQSEVDTVISDYVCPVCTGDLQYFYIPNNPRVVVVCPIHGNVCDIGRVTRNTVSIESEKSFRSYQEVIRNLSDLWGDMIHEGLERHKAEKMMHTHVCAVCGGQLYMYLKEGDTVDLECQRHNLHRFVKSGGYIRRDNYAYNFQAIKDWEKQNKRSK